MDPALTSEADYGMTDMAFRGQQARYAGDKNLIVSFNVEPMQNDAKSTEEGRPVFDNVEHVRIMVPGNKDSIVHRPVTDEDKRRFAKQYEDWKSRGKVPLEGTPLEMWSWVNRGQVEEMKYFNIHTVEQLSEMPDVHAQKFMGINQLRQRARVWLAQVKEGKEAAQVAASMEQLQNENATLKQALEETQAMIGALKMQVQQIQTQQVAPAPTPAKGRRKATAEA